VECLTRYTRGVDRHDPDLVRTAYLPGAIDYHGPFNGNAQKFVDQVDAQHVHWRAHQHYVTNTHIELDGDTAHVETYWIMAGHRLTGEGVDLNGGRYIDRFERRDGRWGIAYRVCVREWGSVHHATENMPGLDEYVTGRQNRDDVSYQRPLMP
jgi:hypothetical protein